IELLHAEKGLILFRDENSGELAVEVARQMDKRSIENVVALSSSVIKKVESEEQPVLLQKVPDMEEHNTSTSLARYKIKSVICVPLRSKEKLIGTIYLDTTDSKHFFKQEDLAFLEGFANLAGIAIENAKSYQEIQNLNENLEQKVEERTRKLQEAQAQLFQSEKMASLGMLVAGVAHEINTPIGSISSNTDMFQRGFKKLKQQFKKTSKAPLGEMGKKLDVLENLSNVNKNACDRITQIVKNLRNFARLDEGELKTVDLHEGIDSTLALIDHLSRDRIQIIKEYGDIPKVNCYANQLNQVFMNMLVNACQAIEDKGEIRIKTYSKDDTIYIEFRDTGVGIPSENLRKIFDPGFTTKGVGVGTGLGLSISYKILQEHGGTIDVESEPGKGSVFTLKLPVNHKMASDD
ncbi:GAF domain-containing protein, partial [candidate division KSB1 bacterium]|nr:GAF domain-containing protein [candidate division KSB1 bacterium]NIR69801.1 GAF domain-containing protein [candidate division KSB1 bacterium]NIS25791.1 GAF domain-containing protein [candidate division KSB1 bacterium]NIT72665.1 GAF domain-containing protein [candidate division KSB1 bacterium]NIU26480.1 GAF domain-containing protein [candidate division KSB1 bacterium]